MFSNQNHFSSRRPDLVAPVTRDYVATSRCRPQHNYDNNNSNNNYHHARQLHATAPNRHSISKPPRRDYHHQHHQRHQHHRNSASPPQRRHHYNQRNHSNQRRTGSKSPPPLPRPHFALTNLPGPTALPPPHHRPPNTFIRPRTGGPTFFSAPFHQQNQNTHKRTRPDSNNDQQLIPSKRQRSDQAFVPPPPFPQHHQQQQTHLPLTTTNNFNLNNNNEYRHRNEHYRQQQHRPQQFRKHRSFNLYPENTPVPNRNANSQFNESQVSPRRHAERSLRPSHYHRGHYDDSGYHPCDSRDRQLPQQQPRIDHVNDAHRATPLPRQASDPQQVSNSSPSPSPPPPLELPPPSIQYNDPSNLLPPPNDYDAAFGTRSFHKWFFAHHKGKKSYHLPRDPSNTQGSPKSSPTTVHNQEFDRPDETQDMVELNRSRKRPRLQTNQTIDQADIDRLLKEDSQKHRRPTPTEQQQPTDASNPTVQAANNTLDNHLPNQENDSGNPDNIHNHNNSNFNNSNDGGNLLVPTKHANRLQDKRFEGLVQAQVEIKDMFGSPKTTGKSTTPQTASTSNASPQSTSVAGEENLIIQRPTDGQAQAQPNILNESAAPAQGLDGSNNVQGGLTGVQGCPSIVEDKALGKGEGERNEGVDNQASLANMATAPASLQQQQRQVKDRTETRQASNENSANFINIFSGNPSAPDDVVQIVPGRDVGTSHKRSAHTSVTHRKRDGGDVTNLPSSEHYRHLSSVFGTSIKDSDRLVNEVRDCVVHIGSKRISGHHFDNLQQDQKAFHNYCSTSPVSGPSGSNAMERSKDREESPRTMSNAAAVSTHDNIENVHEDGIQKDCAAFSNVNVHQDDTHRTSSSLNGSVDASPSAKDVHKSVHESAQVLIPEAQVQRPTTSFPLRICPYAAKFQYRSVSSSAHANTPKVKQRAQGHENNLINNVAMGDDEKTLTSVQPIVIEDGRLDNKDVVITGAKHEPKVVVILGDDLASNKSKVGSAKNEPIVLDGSNSGSPIMLDSGNDGKHSPTPSSPNSSQSNANDSPRNDIPFAASAKGSIRSAEMDSNGNRGVFKKNPLRSVPHPGLATTRKSATKPQIPASRPLIPRSKLMIPRSAPVSPTDRLKNERRVKGPLMPLRSAQPVKNGCIAPLLASNAKRALVGGGNVMSSKASSSTGANSDGEEDDTPVKGGQTRYTTRSKTVKQRTPCTKEKVDTVDLTTEDGKSRRAFNAEKVNDLEKTVKRVGRIGLCSLSEELEEIEERVFLDELLEAEREIVDRATVKVRANEVLVSNPKAGIRLLGSDMKRLRGLRWLNDEVINAYVHLINKRNDEIFSSSKGQSLEGVPRTVMFNSFFYTRLTDTASGYDYEGVRRWTKRASVDVLDYDLILVPVNLGNHHWVLGAIDMKQQMFLYLDSMKGKDPSGVLGTLQQWLHDEVVNKRGKSVADEMGIKDWRMTMNQYIIRRTGVLPPKCERPTAVPGRFARVPQQTDGGSCGVFVSKIADCLALGIKVYMMQDDIHLIRSRMTLDLLRMKLPIR